MEEMAAAADRQLAADVVVATDEAAGAAAGETADTMAADEAAYSYTGSR